jgi:exosortase A-associated hydrolase 2
MQQAPEAFFQAAPHSGPGSQRLYLHHSPAAGASVRAAVLYVHPWAEEVNKSRRMAALASRALAARGCAVLQVDLLGCGDSSGDFADASWEAWLADLAQAAQWLQARHPGVPLWLWGLRAGALLATHAAQTHAGVFGRCHFLLWQPAVSGKTLLQQFLRLKTAGQLAQAAPEDPAPPGGAGATPPAARGPGTEALRQQLKQGQALEVAGYTLPPALALGLDTATLTPPEQAPHGLAQPRRMVWLECSTREEALDLLPASQAAVQRWAQAGYAVQTQVVRGPAFWQTTEIEDAPALVEATLSQLATEPATAVLEPT